MSTRINTNVTAFQAARNLNTSGDKLAQNIQRLSSGLRINSAADDAAGLVISTEFKGQISGLDQATRNSNDGINEVKTAEGALNEVHSLLISIRQAANHASNTGVNSDKDVAADQLQIQSALHSINRIASTTQFGNKKLLDGSASSASSATSGSAAVSNDANFKIVSQGTWNSADAFQYTSATLSTTPPATITVGTTQFNGQASPADTLSGANATFGGSVQINGKAYQITGASQQDLTAFNAALTPSGYQAAFNGAGALVFTAQKGGQAVPPPTIDTSQLVISGAAPATLPGIPAATSGTVTFAPTAGTGGLLTSFVGPVSNSTPISVQGTLQLTDNDSNTSFSKTYVPGTTVGQVQKDLDTAFGSGNTVIDTDATGALEIADYNSGNFTSSSTDFVAYNTAAIPATSTVVNGTNPTLSLSDGTHTMVSTTTTTVGGTNYYQFANGTVISSSVAGSSAGTTALTGSLTGTAGKQISGQDLQLQIGSNSGQTASVEIGSIAADQIGTHAAAYTDADGNSQAVLTTSLRDLDVTTFKGAQDALAVTDQAIGQISSLRASLGAFQSNILGSNIRSLGVASQNVKASQSMIMDTDLSSEIVDFTKNQILMQAGTSALSQANQQPQAILKLLNG